MKKFKIALTSLLLVCLVAYPVTRAVAQDAGGLATWMMSGEVTVVATSQTILVSSSTVPSGARQVKPVSCTLRLVKLSGSTVYVKTNPDSANATAVVTDHWVLTDANPSVELGDFRPQIVKAISAGSTLLRYELTVIK